MQWWGKCNNRKTELWGGKGESKSDRTSACWSASSGPGLPGTSLFLSSFNLCVGTAVHMQLTSITNSEFFHFSHPAGIPTLTHTSFLPPAPALTNNNRTKSPSPFFHPALKTALSVMPASYEVWL